MNVLDFVSYGAFIVFLMYVHHACSLLLCLLIY